MAMNKLSSCDPDSRRSSVCSTASTNTHGQKAAVTAIKLRTTYCASGDGGEVQVEVEPCDATSHTMCRTEIVSVTWQYEKFNAGQISVDDFIYSSAKLKDSLLEANMLIKNYEALVSFEKEGDVWVAVWENTDGKGAFPIEAEIQLALTAKMKSQMVEVECEPWKVKIRDPEGKQNACCVTM